MLQPIDITLSAAGVAVGIGIGLGQDHQCSPNALIAHAMPAHAQLQREGDSTAKVHAGNRLCT